MKLNFLFMIILLLLGTQVSMGQDSEDSPENLQKEMQNQRSQYQAILKAVGGEGVENDPDFQKMVKEGMKDPQQMIKKLQEIRSKNGKEGNIGNIGGSKGGNTGTPSNISLAQLLKGDASGMVRVMIQQFNHVSPSELKSKILMTTEGKPQGNFLKNNPKFLDFIVASFKHPSALPDFARILDQKQKLTYFVGANIFIFFFGMWFKRVQKNRNQESDVTKRMNHFIFRTIFFLGLRIAVFVSFFHAEAGPIFGVFKDTVL